MRFMIFYNGSSEFVFHELKIKGNKKFIQKYRTACYLRH